MPLKLEVHKRYWTTPCRARFHARHETRLYMHARHENFDLYGTERPKEDWVRDERKVMPGMKAIFMPDMWSQIFMPGMKLDFTCPA